MSKIGKHLGKVRQGLMLIIAAPSGGGKGTVVKKLMEQDDNLHVSVSVTTRGIRPGEEDGVHYYFKSKEEYEKLIEEDKLYEHAEVFGNYYGTLKSEVDSFIHVGQDVIFDIDWQGARQLAEKAPDSVVKIFLLPPSIEELRDRLENRKTDSKDVIEGRMAQAVSEISHWSEFDYIVVNDDIDEAVYKVRKILSAERMKRCRQMDGLKEFVATLIK